MPDDNRPARRVGTAREVRAHVVVRDSGRQVDVQPSAVEPAITWVASGEALLEIRPGGGMARTAVMKRGDFYLSAAALPTEVCWTNDAGAPLVTVHIAIGLPLMLQALRDVLGMAPTACPLRDALGERDDILSSLVDLVYRSLKGGSQACNGFMQGVSQALAAHIVRAYRKPGPVPPAVPGGLPAYKLHRVCNAMRDCLGEPFDLERLAKHAGLSVYHFSRAFKRTTGMTPSRYFVNLRIEEAKRMLCDTRHGVIDVAFALGYRSPSHFSQVFRELTGVSPSAYRNLQ